MEKLPLLALAIAASGAALFTHTSRPHPLPFLARVANAVISYVAYLGQLFVPTGLSAFYSLPEAGWPAWQVATAALLLLAITSAALIGRRSQPYFFVGWFWYVTMLIPVLGLTLVGGHARADRYTYLSQIGLYIALVWGALRLAESWPARRWVFGIGSAVILLALMACAWRQTGYWLDDRTLWEHALALSPKNATAHATLGMALAGKDDVAAAAEYQKALEVTPSARNVYYTVRAGAQLGLGDIAARKGDNADAVSHYEQAIEWDSRSVPAHMQLGGILAKTGDLDGAAKQFQRSIELRPDVAMGYLQLGLTLARQEKPEQAIANFRSALAIDPNFAVAHMSLANVLAARDETEEAIVHFRRAIEIDPSGALPYHQLAGLLRKQGKHSQAARYDAQGKQTSLRFAEVQNTHGRELLEQRKLDQAIACFRLAISAAPDHAQAQCNLAEALALEGNVDNAITHYRRALKIDPNLAPAKQALEQLTNH
jgi:protein O-mannosyl-transferase